MLIFSKTNEKQCGIVTELTFVSRKRTWLFINKFFQWLYIFLPAMKRLCIDEEQWLVYVVVEDLFS